MILETLIIAIPLLAVFYAAFFINSAIKTRIIKKLETELNEKLAASGSTERYECKIEDWFHVDDYDLSPFVEAKNYMKARVAEPDKKLSNNETK